MSNLNNILKENLDLRTELENTIKMVRENDAKHKGFKAVQYACLLSETLGEISAKPLKYLEEIFGIEKAVLFIREGAYAVANGCVRAGERVFVCGGEAFDYTFLEKRPYSGSNEILLHESFRIMKNAETYSFVLVPITEGDEAVGALGLYCEDEEKFGAGQNFDFITELSFIMAISLKRLNDSYMLAMRAQTDYLTGLPNKSMMELTADRWLERYKLYERPFVFVLLDLDNFKYVNDRLGHLVGDEVLKKVARGVRRVIGGNDLLGRFGGDEFYLFVDNADTREFEKTQQAIISAVDEVSSGLNLSPALGISAGGVRIPDDLDSAGTFMELVKLADERLYKIKSGGKGGFCGITDNS